MEPTSDPVVALEAALAFDQQGIVERPLDVIGWIDSAAVMETTPRENLWIRLFLEAPLPYWLIARWALQSSSSDLSTLLAKTESPGWECVNRYARGDLVSREDIMTEVDSRFEQFDPDLFPWTYGPNGEDPPQFRKYLLGRELARTYVRQEATNEDQSSKRTALLLDHKEAWQEWLEMNTSRGHSVAAVAEATSMALDRIVSQRDTVAANGVGRTHILLEQLTVTKNPAVGVVTASIMPVPEDFHHLSGIVVPDLRENGLLVMSREFLAGVAASWEYFLSTDQDSGPSMLCFAIRPNVASVVQQISGRSAELAVLAAIESAARKRALRPNAAASASLDLYGPAGAFSDPRTGPASFEDKKYIAALKHRIATVIVHPEVAHQWRKQHQPEKAAGDPDVVASEYYRRDALRFLETRSLWKMAITVPAAVTAAYALLAIVWQMFKLSSVAPDLKTVVLASRLPLVSPALMLTEVVCMAICLYIIQLSYSSIRTSLDSHRSAWIAFGICSLIVLCAQFLPIGVRGEGLLDNPVYSVLLGQPQITAADVCRSGGTGFLVLHTVAQTIGFITIQFGTSAFALRLLQTRAHGEPHFDDRCSLIEADWRFSLSMIIACFAVVLFYGLFRNLLWYYYLTTLPDVAVIDEQGSFLAILAPLLGVCVVLAFSVGIVWLIVIGSYLIRVVDSAQGRSGYRPADVVTRLPRVARWIYRLRPSF